MVNNKPTTPHKKGTRSYEDTLKLIEDNEKEAQRPRIEKLGDYGVYVVPTMNYGDIDVVADEHIAEMRDTINEIITELQRLSDEVRSLKGEERI